MAPKQLSNKSSDNLVDPEESATETDHVDLDINLESF